MNRREYFDFVNIAKLILAVAIVAVHCALVSDDSPLMLLLCRLGVPYFFIASGFFLNNKCADGNCESAVNRYIKRLMLPYAVFSAVWIAQMLIDDAIGGFGMKESAISLIQHILFFPRGALWYVWASILGVLMLYPFMKRGKLIRALPLGVALFAVGLLANNYYFIADSSRWLKPAVDAYLRIFLVSNNAPFVAFVFLLLGMLMAEYYDKLIRAIRTIPTILILTVSVSLLIMESSFIRSKAVSVGDGAFYLSQLIYVPTVFFLTTRIKCPHISASIVIGSKNLSTGIYFLHVPILWIIHRAAKYMLPHLPGLNRMAPLFDHPSVCFVCCMILCTAICLLAYRHPKSFICRILK